MLARQIQKSSSFASSRALIGLPPWNSRSSDSQMKEKDSPITDILSRVHSRPYHASAKKEILPLVAVGSLLMIGRWSWKALNRMDDEWEDYQWQLQQYERERMRDSSNVSDMTTIGVDLGSVYLKISTIDGDKPQMVTTSQGDRYRFAGIAKGEKMNSSVRGSRAMEKFYYRDIENLEGGDAVVLPFHEFNDFSTDGCSSLVKQIVAPAVEEAMERLSKPRARVVLAIPPGIFNQKEATLVQNMDVISLHSIIVPDPVASIWGARTCELIPEPSTKEEKAVSSLVIDIGGLVTSMSLVSDDIVEASCHLNLVGGETYVKRITDLLLQEIADETLNTDALSLALIDSSARSATVELVSKSDVQVHIPFLFMGRKDEEPHFEMRISRSLVDKTVEDNITSEIVPQLVETGILSTSLPLPRSTSALFTSGITKVLEESEKTPNDVECVLLVGGGSKHPLFERAFREGVESLFGPGSQRVVVPETSLRADITALGASSLLPNFDYSSDDGLKFSVKES